MQTVNIVFFQNRTKTLLMDLYHSTEDMSSNNESINQSKKFKKFVQRLIHSLERQLNTVGLTV